MKHFLCLFSVLLLAFFTSCKSHDAEYYVEREMWDDVLTLYETPADSTMLIDIWNVNRALALEGRLADDAFKYTQHGPEGLFPQWNRSSLEGAMLSDIYYSAGLVALAQRFAFESDVILDEGHDERMIKRLVETNIIYGAWPVAEKYISFLENRGGVWKDWASSRRRFLYNDAAVDSDPEYGPLRRCIPEDDFIAGERGIYDDLSDIIRANPERHDALEILGTLLLLECDFESFRTFIDDFYGTEALVQLPVSFAEAACLMSELDRGWWKKVGVSPDLYKRYTDFVKRFGNGLSVERYRGTYWYYVMRLNAK